MPAADGAGDIADDIVGGVETPDSVRVRAVEHGERTAIRCGGRRSGKRVIRAVVRRLVIAGEDSSGVRQFRREFVGEGQADEVRGVVATGIGHQHELLPAGTDQQHVDIVGDRMGKIGEDDDDVRNEAGKIGDDDGGRIGSRWRCDGAEQDGRLIEIGTAEGGTGRDLVNQEAGRNERADQPKQTRPRTGGCRVGIHECKRHFLTAIFIRKKAVIRSFSASRRC